MTNKKDSTSIHEQMARIGNDIERGTPKEITIAGRKWKLRPISMRQSAKIANLAFDALNIQREQKQGTTPKRARKLNERLRRIPAKQAAHIVLGRWLWLIPFAHAWMWRKIYNMPEETCAMINATHAVQGEDRDFFMVNLQNIKQLLALSTMQVGESEKQMEERKANADGMVEKDASKTEEEESK